jgi:hypothetical protein
LFKRKLLTLSTWLREEVNKVQVITLKAVGEDTMSALDRFVAEANYNSLVLLAVELRRMWSAGSGKHLDVLGKKKILAAVNKVMDVFPNMGGAIAKDTCVNIMRILTCYHACSTAALLHDAVYKHPAWKKWWKLVTSRLTAQETVGTSLDVLYYIANVLTDSQERLQVLFEEDDIFLKWLMMRCNQQLHLTSPEEQNALIILLGSIQNKDTIICGCACPEKEFEKQVFTTLLEDGFLHAVMKVSMALLSKPAEEAVLLQDFIFETLLRMFSRTEEFPPASTPAEDYMLTRNDIFRFATIVYARLHSFDCPPTVILFAALFAKYLKRLYGTDMLELYLLYKPPRREGAVTLVEVVIQVAQASKNAQLEGKVIAVLRANVDGSPEVVALLDKACADCPVQDDKDRHCSFPDCIVTGEGLVGAQMMKCGRCKAVYYCSKIHQELHWPKHKASCRRGST